MDHIVKYDLARSGQPLDFLEDGAVVGGTAVASTFIGDALLRRAGMGPATRNAALGATQVLGAVALAKKSPRVAIGLLTGGLVAWTTAALATAQNIQANKQLAANQQAANQTPTQPASGLRGLGAGVTRMSAGLNPLIPVPVRY